MKKRSLLAILTLGAFLACSPGSDEKGADTVSVDPNAESSGTQPNSDATESPADSIPMSVTVTLPSVSDAAGTFHGGTFRSEGKGAQCERFTNGGEIEWSVLFPGSSDSLGVASVRLNVGKLTGGKTSFFNVMAVAGSIQGKGGPKTPLTHVISTRQPGPEVVGTAPASGSGIVTVTREGKRVRFEVDGVSGTTSKAFKMTLVCEREGKWI